MDIYRSALLIGLKFKVAQGNVSLETFCSLRQSSLAKYLRDLNSQMKRDDKEGLDFLNPTAKTSEEKLNDLRFKIAKDLYIMKKAESDRLKEKENAKEKNQEILAEMARRKKENLTKMSDEELEKMLTK